eukprot:gb/GECH01013035.1/.p1 GENE.gb/GECH01013035.1/~~gb/GECH01013035.1/.p1  ORF type:complete len:386 (+),score=98.09 gb/GECH01013035.1/:1-1158(+)
MMNIDAEVKQYQICYRTFNPHTLMLETPPRWYSRNKRVLAQLSCPETTENQNKEETASPTENDMPMAYSRWSVFPRPRTINLEALVNYEKQENAFDYLAVSERQQINSSTSDKPLMRWYLNFSDSNLFGAYSGPLFAQDEMQVGEHPSLGALREKLKKISKDEPEFTPITRQGIREGAPTPVLVRNVPRRVEVKTDVNAKEGRPFGLYGNRFALASEDAIHQATRILSPPTLSNIIAMEAPCGRKGEYTLSDINLIFDTAFSGFKAAVIDSKRSLIEHGSDSKQKQTEQVEVEIHTGHWGGGAYGGNKDIMVILQILAATAAHADRLVYHTFTDVEPYLSGVTGLELLLGLVERRYDGPMNKVPLSLVFDALQSMGYEWGIGDGN